MLCFPSLHEMKVMEAMVVVVMVVMVLDSCGPALLIQWCLSCVVTVVRVGLCDATPVQHLVSVTAVNTQGNGEIFSAAVLDIISEERRDEREVFRCCGVRSLVINSGRHAPDIPTEHRN